MALTKEKKQEQVTLLVDKMKQSSSVVFTTYDGTTVADQTKVRNTLREQDAELKVAKKTLVRLAAKEIGIEDLGDNALDGQVAVAFSYAEPTVGPQTIKKLSKEIKALELRGGIFEGRALTNQEVKDLADLPPKEVLLAKLIGSMQAPVSQFVGIGNNLVSGFVRVLDKHRENQEK